ncbi:hypothetical protein CALCODRAFT_553487 [Calocera cornea HHB12733]|uniref:Uncharacterized protein n=1 Tax=Calocera cornea HHB12733 TaxID=1353952 RepID=A0A165IMR1_9BASI|nr:hypothetical protein CALCODRAFT_553487 [Calocera cornea HHB12733]
MGVGVVGALVIQVSTSAGPHYTIIPLAIGDETPNLANTGLLFVDETRNFTDLDNRLVAFKIANGASTSHPFTCVISFNSTLPSGGYIATLELINGQLGWLGATGYCTFLQQTAQPAVRHLAGFVK